MANNQTPLQERNQQLEIAVFGERLSNMDTNLKDFKTNVEKQLNSINASVKQLTETIDAKYVTKEEIKVIDTKVQNLEGIMTWVARLVIGAVIVAVLGLVIVPKL